MAASEPDPLASNELVAIFVGEDSCLTPESAAFGGSLGLSSVNNTFTLREPGDGMNYGALIVISSTSELVEECMMPPLPPRPDRLAPPPLLLLPPRPDRLASQRWLEIGAKACGLGGLCLLAVSAVSLVVEGTRCSFEGPCRLGLIADQCRGSSPGPECLGWALVSPAAAIARSTRRLTVWPADSGSSSGSICGSISSAEECSASSIRRAGGTSPIAWCWRSPL